MISASMNGSEAGGGCRIDIRIESQGDANAHGLRGGSEVSRDTITTPALRHESSPRALSECRWPLVDTIDSWTEIWLSHMGGTCNG